MPTPDNVTPSHVTPSHVTHNDDRNRYELEVDGKLAVSEYNRLTRAVMFTHTEVPEALEGQGVGSALARGALGDVRCAMCERRDLLLFRSVPLSRPLSAVTRSTWIWSAPSAGLK